MKKKNNCLFKFLEKGITQIAWVVEDLDQAVKHLHEFFGIGPWYYYNYGSPLLKTMKRNGIEAEYNMATAVANVGSLRLELIQPLEGDMVYNDFVKKYGYGFGRVQHFGLAVENMEDSLKVIKEDGIKVVMEGTGYGLDGDGHFAYLDTEKLIGITLELMERPKKRHKPIKVYPGE